MNAKNGPNAMNVNKIFLLSATAFFGLHSIANAAEPALVQQDKSGTLTVIEKSADSGGEPAKKPDGPSYLTPSLYGLREIMVQYPIFIDPRAATECGLNREPLLTVMQRNLQDPNLEIMVQNETHERRAVRADLTYEIYTTRQDQSCISFVSMYFTDRASIILPPLKVPRALTITYWQKAQIARSPADRHQTSVGDALAAMGRNFLRDVKLAEPATYNAEQKKPQASEEDERAERQVQMMRSINESVSRRLINQGGGADLPSIGGAPPTKEDERQ